MHALKGWILNIAATIVFVTIVEIMVPEGSTRKYVGLVVGLMVIFAIINPLLTILSGDFDLGQNILLITDAIHIRDVSLQIDKLKQGNRGSILGLYKSNLEEQIKRDFQNSGLGEEVLVEVEIDEQQDSGYFGKIIGMNIVLQDRPDNDSLEDIVRVEDVEIIIDDGIEKMREGPLSEQQEMVKQLAHMYNVPEDRIVIVSE